MKYLKQITSRTIRYVSAIHAFIYLFLGTILLDTSDIMYHLAFNSYVTLCVIIFLLFLSIKVIYESCLSDIAKYAHAEKRQVRLKWKVASTAVALFITTLSTTLLISKEQYSYDNMYINHVMKVKTMICDSESPVHAARELKWHQRTLKLAINKAGFSDLYSITSEKKSVTDFGIKSAEAKFNARISVYCNNLNQALVT